MRDHDQRHELASTMSTLARNLAAEPDEDRTLAGTVQAATATVPGVRAAGITQVHRQRVHATVPTDDLVRRCDETQEELREGPCPDAIWNERTVISNDLAEDPRWPRFGNRAVELGVGSTVSFQLYVQRDALGALNLYGHPEARFGDEAQLIGEVFAAHAALALSEARQYPQLNEALASRDAIGQAKGLLVQQHDITGQRAFELLVQASQDANIKLTDVATWLVAEHERPGQATRPRNT